MAQINVSQEELNVICKKVADLQRGFNGALKAHEQSISGIMTRLKDDTLQKEYGNLYENFKKDTNEFNDKLHDVIKYVTKINNLIEEYKAV